GRYGPFTLTATAATGEFGNSNTFKIDVTHKTGTVSVAAITDPQTVEEQSTLTVTPSATLGACAAGPVTWSVSPALPAGATFSTSTGEIVWTPACGDVGSYGPVTLTATAATTEAGSSNAVSIDVTDMPVTVTPAAIAAPTAVAAASTLTGPPTGARAAIAAAA